MGISEELKHVISNKRIYERFGYHRQTGYDKDIFIFSIPRSRTTWLFELLLLGGNMRKINEPLHPHMIVSIKSIRKFFSNDYFRKAFQGLKDRIINLEKNEEPLFYRYFNEDVSGRAGTDLEVKNSFFSNRNVLIIL